MPQTKQQVELVLSPMDLLNYKRILAIRYTEAKKKRRFETMEIIKNIMLKLNA